MLGDPMALSSLVTLVVIALWASARLPEYLVALLFFAAVMVLQLAPAAVTFSGFASSAFWLVLSGFVLGTAIRSTGLADRLANRLLPHLAGSWPRLVGGVVAISYALAFVMPSNMGRITLLMPIVMALADRAGLGEGSRGRIGLALAVGFGTFQLSASILPANVPNLVMSGAAESAYGSHFAYLSYLLLHAPVLGIAKGALLTLCICGLFRARPQPVAAEVAQTPLSAAEWRLIALLGATVLLWMTDSWHGIAPAWIGLVAACVCLLPRIGFLNGEQFAAGVNVRTCIYVAGILGLTALVSHSGAWRSAGRCAAGNDAGSARQTVHRIRFAGGYHRIAEFCGNRQRRAGAVYPAGAGVVCGQRLAAADGADDPGDRLRHAAAAVSGLADRGGDGDGQSAGA